MEYIIAVIGALIGGVFFFKGKAEKNAAKAMMAETKAKDAELEKKGKVYDEMIGIVDDTIKQAALKKEEDKKKRKYMTLAERRAESNKRFGDKK
jgi:hypothetical protein